MKRLLGTTLAWALIYGCVFLAWNTGPRLTWPESAVLFTVIATGVVLIRLADRRAVE